MSAARERIMHGHSYPIGLVAALSVALGGTIALVVPAVGAPPSAAGTPASKDSAAGAKPGKSRPAAGALTGHGGPIKAVRVDAARGRALTGSFDYAMTVWDVSGETPRQLHRLDQHNGAVNAVAFLPDGRRALAGSDDGTVTLWDIEAGKILHRFAGHQNKVIGLAVSPDGLFAASASWDRTARIWDLATLTPGPVLAGHKGPVNAVAFSADGRRLYTAGYDGMIGRWRADGTFERPLARLGWGVNVIARVPDSENIAYGTLNGSAGVVDGATGQPVVPLKGHDRPVLALAVIAKPGLIATGGADGVIRVSRLADGAVTEEFRTPYGPVWALAFTEGGSALYYGGLDDFAGRWQIAPREAFEPVVSSYPRRFQIEGGGDDPVEQGRLQFARKCSVCHTLTPDGANRAGPTLYRIFGRPIASVSGYPYSPPLKSLDIVWTEAMVEKLFELGPDVVTPGSKMPLQKMTDARQRKALIAYLRQATAGP
ncbi:MAG: c-type cytochrome [Hyphomicrobiaceae bacterium]